jgi:hypothetical protein
MVRTALALVAFIVFAFNAFTMGDGFGDPGVAGIYSLIRAIFIGLAILALAVVEWDVAIASLKKAMAFDPNAGTPGDQRD